MGSPAEEVNPSAGAPGAAATDANRASRAAEARLPCPALTFPALICLELEDGGRRGFMAMDGLGPDEGFGMKDLGLGPDESASNKGKRATWGRMNQRAARGKGRPCPCAEEEIAREKGERAWQGKPAREIGGRARTRHRRGGGHTGSPLLSEETSRFSTVQFWWCRPASLLA